MVRNTFKKSCVIELCHGICIENCFYEIFIFPFIILTEVQKEILWSQLREVIDINLGIKYLVFMNLYRIELIKKNVCDKNLIR